MPGAVGLDWSGFAISTRLISLSILPSPDDVTSFILRWLFGQGVIVALILSIKALYGWYCLAKGAAAASGKVASTIKVRRDQLHAVRLYGLVLPVIVLSLIGTIIWIWGIATLIHKQIATGGAFSSAPYGLFALLLGVIGISILWAVAASVINGSGGGANISPAAGIVPAIVLAVIVAVVVSIHAKPSPPVGTDKLKLECDQDASYGHCASVGSDDVIALDIIGSNVYTLCNEGYSLHFIDNHGQDLDTTTGVGCLTTDSFILGGSSPYIKFGVPIHSSTGKPFCGRWVITLQVDNPSGAVISTARYETNVRC
jgi:hypothetical protein